jgi:protein-S-isoprenylcysteine O-methyltransferase Ste14
MGLERAIVAILWLGWLVYWTVGALQACVGFAIIFLSFLRQLTLEEIWLRSYFGAEYELYQKRVKALIPHP